MGGGAFEGWFVVDDDDDDAGCAVHAGCGAGCPGDAGCGAGRAAGAGCAVGAGACAWAVAEMSVNAPSTATAAPAPRIT